MIKTCWKNLPLLLSFVPYVHFALLLDFYYHSVSGFITLIFLSLFAGYYFQKAGVFYLYLSPTLYLLSLPIYFASILLNGGTFIIL